MKKGVKTGYLYVNFSQNIFHKGWKVENPVSINRWISREN